jgi:hypothetical protein
MGSLKEMAMEADDDRNSTHLAEILGITSDELNQLYYTIESNSGNDDMIYGYRIEFSDASPKDILGKIERLENGRLVNLNLWELDESDEEE